MLPGTNKLFIALTAIASMLTSCGVDAEKKAASQLLEDARTAIGNKQYESALRMLDTLSTRHSKITDVVKEAIALRPVAIEGATIAQIEQTDSLLAMAAWRADSLSNLFRTVSDTRLVEPYTVAKSAPGNLYSRTGIEARVTPDGAFNIISSLTGHKIKHTSISLSHGDEVATSETVPLSSEANYSINGSETVTFSVNKCDTIGRFAVMYDNMPLRLTFNGTKSHTVTLPAKEVHAIADTYRLASARLDKIMFNKQKELLRAKLQLARDQQARTSTIKTEED